MRLAKLLKRKYKGRSVNTLGVTFDSPVGVSIYSKSPASLVTFLCDSCYSFGIIGSADLTGTISTLISAPMDTNVFYELDFKSRYNFGGKEKLTDAAFAIMYDFVDGFIISGYDDLQEQLDQLITMRMYNDRYIPIILRLDSHLLQEDIDEIISYAMLSNVDGLLISNMKHLEYADSRSKGNLTLMFQTAAENEKSKEALDKGASLIVVSSGRFPLLSFFKGRRLIKYLSSLFF